MADWILVFTYVVPLIGVIVGYGLATISGRRENKKRVERLRRLVYADVLRLFISLSKIVYYSEEYLKYPEIDTGDADTLSALLKFNRAAVEMTLSNEWYKSARAEPFFFSQLPKKEQDAINRVYDLQLHITNENLFNAALEATIKKVDKSERPKVQFIASKISTIDTFKKMKKAIQEGLDKGLLIDVSSEQTREVVTFIYETEEREQDLRDIIEQVSAKL